MSILCNQMSLLLLSGFMLLGMAAATSKPSFFSHQDWSAVLSRFVDERGRVNYEALARDRAVFDRYVAEVENVSPKSAPALFPTRNDELAYYINAYNALVFKGVLARGPESKSVWRGLISGYTFFVRMEIVVGGEKTNLKRLEDRVIREGFTDPRIHAALNCASVSCPRLPQKAFDAERLDEELDLAMAEFVGDEKHLQIDHTSQELYLSKIFDWYREDFLDYERRHGNPEPMLINYVNRYREEGARVPQNYNARFMKYDKRINKQ